MARRRFNFWIDDELRDGLKTVRDRDGIVESEQIRRAIRKWLQSKRVSTTTRTGARRGRKRPG